MTDRPAAPPADVVARLADIEARLDALEANLTDVEAEQADPGELDRLRWFVKHGRRRPW